MGGPGTKQTPNKSIGNGPACTNKAQQTDASGGYFHREWGNKIHIEGAFRYYDKYLEN